MKQGQTQTSSFPSPVTVLLVSDLKQVICEQKEYVISLIQHQPDPASLVISLLILSLEFGTTECLAGTFW